MSGALAENGKAKDWHSSKHIAKRARYLLNHPDLEIPSDVAFLVGDGQNEPRKTFKCHKFLLAMVSSMFQTMFYGSFPETEDPIKIPDVSPTAFQLMLRYAYGERIKLADVGSLENALDTLYCAKKYIIDKLARTCRGRIQFLIGTFQEDPCVVFQRAPQMDEEDLTVLALAMIALNAAEVLHGDGLPRLSFNCLKAIVDYPHLNAEEPDVYLGVRRWVEHNVDAVEGRTLRDDFGSLLYSIRFPLFSATELADGPVMDGLLTSREASSVVESNLAEITPMLPFVVAPRTPLPAPLMCTFARLHSRALIKEFCVALGRDPQGSMTEQVLLEARPDLAPECCAFLRRSFEAGLHVPIAFYSSNLPANKCDVHKKKPAPFSAAVAEERNALLHSVTSACWFEWDDKEGAVCDFRIGIGRKPHRYHSAVFGYLLGLQEKDQWVPFELWDDQRIKEVDQFRMCLSDITLQ